MRRSLFVILVVSFWTNYVAAQDAAQSPAQTAVIPATLGTTPNVSQFGKWTFAGQPTPADLATVRDSGIETVITLRESEEIDWDERSAVEQLQLKFVQLPVAGPAGLSTENLNIICETLAKVDGEPVLLHCRTASRVGAVWLAFRVTRQGTSVEQAQQEAAAIGLKNEQLLAAVKSYIALRQEKSTSKGDRPTSLLPSDINKDFLDPNLDVQKWIGRFELESREIFAARTEIVRACQIQPGQRVADVGAGTGLFTRLFASATGSSGWVYAIEISPAFVRHIREQLDHEQLNFVTPILSSQQSINLPPNSIDLAFVCDTYHHFEKPDETLNSIHTALNPGGTLIVIDFERIPGQSRQWVLDHVRGDKQSFRQEIESAGFEFVEEVKISNFAENYFLRFRRK